MTCDIARERINELIDGDLDRAARAELDAHLASCPECAALAEDLDVLLRASRSMPELEPPTRVWTNLARQLPGSTVRSMPRPRTREWVKVTLAVAAVLLAAVVITLLVRRGQDTESAPPAQAAATPAAPGTSATSPPAATTPGDSAELRSLQSELEQAESHYENAIQKLEVLAKDRRSLNPQDAAILQKNLLVIDTAIGESRAALRKQPTNEMAQESLFEAFKSKIALLQDTISLINEMRKGNQAEAARISGGLNKS
jgi:hypothetical protein